MARDHHHGTACLIIAGLALTVPLAPLNAQSVPTVKDATASANRLLQSADPTEVAWGAFTATQYRLPSTVPLLVAALGRIDSGDPDPRDAAELARIHHPEPRELAESEILDALVQLHAQVPAAVLRGPLDRFPVPALILLDTATGDRDALLLPRLGVTAGPEWEAIANLLLRSKSPGFAVRLLDGLRLQLDIYVTDQPDRGGIGPGSGGGVERGCNVGYVAPELPPMAAYGFSEGSLSAGVTVLSIGPRTVYYGRSPLPWPMVRCTNKRSDERPTDADRVTYINALTGSKGDAFPLRQRTGALVVWSTASRYREEVSRDRQTIEEQYRHVVSVLVSAGGLTQEESRMLTPTITITVEDGRKDRSVPLPAVNASS